MSKSNIKSITPILLQKLIDSEEVMIIDVREDSEYQTGHITGAKNIPLSLLKNDINVLDVITNREIVVVCHAGIRSMIACQLIEENKKPFDSWNLEGGMVKWCHEKLPLSFIPSHF
jgi:rhodanese-related sulfurtransferase